LYDAQTRGGAEAHGYDQIGNAEELPENEAATVAWIGELPCYEGSCRADGDVAITAGNANIAGRMR